MHALSVAGEGMEYPLIGAYQSDFHDLLQRAVHGSTRALGYGALAGTKLVNWVLDETSGVVREIGGVVDPRNWPEK